MNIARPSYSAIITPTISQQGLVGAPKKLLLTCLFISALGAPAALQAQKAPEKAQTNQVPEADPIDTLVADFSLSYGLWENGAFPIIDLPQTATPEEVLGQVFKMTSFGNNRVKDFKVLEIRMIQIKNSESGSYHAALVGTDLGEKVVLFNYVGRGLWWSRVFEAGKTYYGKPSPSSAESLFPPALNSLLPKIRPGMTIPEVETVLATIYPKVSGHMSQWDGATGEIQYDLNDRFSLGVTSVNRLTDRMVPVVGDHPLFCVYDWHAKHRVEINQYDWSAQSQKSPPADPIGALVAKLSVDGKWGLWQNGLFTSIKLPSSASTEEVIAQVNKQTNLYQAGKLTSYKIIESRPVKLGSALQDKNFTAVLLETNLGKKILLLQYQGASVGWWSRAYDVPVPKTISTGFGSSASAKSAS